MDRLRAVASLPARYPEQSLVLGALAAVWAVVNLLVPWLGVVNFKALAGVPRNGHPPRSMLETTGHALVLAACTGALLLGLYRMRRGGAEARQRRLEQRNDAKAARARREMQELLEQQALRRAQEEEAEQERQRQLREAERQAGMGVVGTLQAAAKPATGTAASKPASCSQGAVAAPLPTPTAAAAAQLSPLPATPAVTISAPMAAGALEAARQQRYDLLQRQVTEAATRHAQEEAAWAAEALAQRQAMAQAAAATSAAPAGEGSGAVVTTRATAASSTSMAPAGGSSGSLHARGGSGSSAVAGGSRPMVSRQAALEAEARQQQWLQQLGSQVDPAAQQSRALEQDRALRQQQDDEYFASLSRDQEAAHQREAQATAAATEEEQRKAKARRLLELTALKEQLKAGLPPEPSPAQPDITGSVDATAAAMLGPLVVVTVRARMPDGSVPTRRWAASSSVQHVYAWVQSLDACPLWEPEDWRLAVSYPRVLLAREESRSVGEVAGGEASLVLMVERV